MSKFIIGEKYIFTQRIDLYSWDDSAEINNLILSYITTNSTINETALFSKRKIYHYPINFEFIPICSLIEEKERSSFSKVFLVNSCQLSWFRIWKYAAFWSMISRVKNEVLL
jgi:hypothetical protein